ncbi:MAG: glycoside hydrolase family 3 protein, partial [Spirochaetales bacterium]
MFCFPLFSQEYNSGDISADEEITFWSDYSHDVLANEIINRMSDEEALAQILMFGWAGAAPSSLLTQWVSERNLGSVKIFG